jgi:hypothetical protein
MTLGVRPTAKYKKRVGNACFRGHVLTPENVYLYGGKRLCRMCRRLRDNAWRKREWELNREPACRFRV